MEASLRNRLIFGPIMLAALLSLLWLDYLAEGWTGYAGIGLLILLLIVIPLATIELATLFAAEKVRPYRIIASVGSGLLVLHAFATQFPRFQGSATAALASIIVVVMIMAALRRAWRAQSQEAITLMAGTLLATLYLGGLAWFLIALRVKDSPNVKGSTMVILMILLCVKFTDIGAYFGGRAIGRHKLIPWLSPGKTWEGLFCGIATAGLVGALCTLAVSTNEMPAWKAAIFGMVIGAIGQLGDLLESLMKRDAEVKDSSSLIPGFGGLLDVIDSPLLAAPVAYWMFSIF